MAQQKSADKTFRVSVTFEIKSGPTEDPASVEWFLFDYVKAIQLPMSFRLTGLHATEIKSA